MLQHLLRKRFSAILDTETGVGRSRKKRRCRDSRNQSECRRKKVSAQWDNIGRESEQVAALCKRNRSPERLETMRGGDSTFRNRVRSQFRRLRQASRRLTNAVRHIVRENGGRKGSKMGWVGYSRRDARTVWNIRYLTSFDVFEYSRG